MHWKNNNMAAKIYPIQGMDCANCARELEDGVSKLPGVKSVRVDYATAKMHLEGDAPFDTLQKRVEALGKHIAENPTVGATHVSPNSTLPTTSPLSTLSAFVRYLASRSETRLALVSG